MNDYTPPGGKFWRGEQRYHWDLPFTMSLMPLVTNWQRRVEVGVEVSDYGDFASKTEYVSMEILENFSNWLQLEIERIKTEFPPQKTAEEIAAIEKVDRVVLHPQRNSPPPWRWKD